ncbi:hypothetical protein [Neobacillus niacini]|uniref:hypothetical protein n=1 Tax=Neobacillus niacini TaxID=86668 RepID=UPI002856A350|nr:hypothetical protein [Neobacillus niacini]MDR7001586.1 hypothetical protein [Neobacillus niacini]
MMKEVKAHEIDGVTYVEVHRKAKVGERIIYTKDSSGIGVKYGDVFIARNVDSGGYVSAGCGAINPRNYAVLELVDEPTVDTAQASPQVIDMLANLARRVTQLESQLAAAQRNLETFAEQAESNSEDIRELDSRTQVLDAINKYYAEGSR